ncbi:oxygenase [Lithospermum erythrorhizon]|uniref:Oxygenase n=1 Tax=Lithospermum erythrorhizon TaxID=34254 RepID=A0AAV3QD40_LITER
MDFNHIQLVLAIVISMVFFHCLEILFRKLKKFPPFPIPLPLIGNLHLVGKKPHKSFGDLAKIYGPIMSLKLGQVTTVVITSPAIAREVLQKHDLAFSSRYPPNAVHALDHYKYSVAWIPVGPRFRSLRKIMNTNIFSGNRLDANQHLRLAKIQELVSYCNRYCETGEALDIGRAVFRTTLNLISNTIFSKDLTDPFSDSDKDDEFKDLISNIFAEVGKPNLLDCYPILEIIYPHGIKRRSGVYFEQMFKICGAMIDERLEQRKALDGPKFHDMLDILLTSSEENPEDIDRKHIEHLCLDLFSAATDSTTSTVEWAMAEVLKCPRVMKKIQEELAQVIGRGKILEEIDIARLPYLNCIVKETFRLHPAAPLLIPRKVEEDVQVCGYVVPKGSKIFVNTWAIGRDPSVWEDSLLYKPERFLQCDIDVRGRDYELIPFGAGRRMCPGLPLANRMVPMMLGTMLNLFEWKLEGGLLVEQLDMEEKDGVILKKAIPLLAVPIPVQAWRGDPTL